MITLCVLVACVWLGLVAVAIDAWCHFCVTKKISMAIYIVVTLVIVAVPISAVAEIVYHCLQ